MAKRLILLVLLLSGCSRYDRTVTELKTTNIEITYAEQISYFNMRYTNLETGERRRVSEDRCPNYKNIQVGSVYEIEYTVISYYRNGKRVARSNEYPSACTIATNFSPIKHPEVKSL